MTQQIEIINGQRLLVTRDDSGKEIARAGADSPPSTVTVEPIRSAARSLLTKPLRNWTVDDDRAVLLFLLRKFCD